MNKAPPLMMDGHNMKQCILKVQSQFQQKSISSISFNNNSPNIQKQLGQNTINDIRRIPIQNHTQIKK